MGHRDTLSPHRRPQPKSDPFVPLPGRYPTPADNPTPYGFDVTAIGFFTLAAPFPQMPLRMGIFELPEQFNYGEVLGLAVEGDPMGVWFNNVTWALTLSEGAPQEFVMQSSIEGLPPDTAGSGLRWVPMGSLQEPQEVLIRINQHQTLGIVILNSTAANNTPVTARCRALGRAYL